jgi:hypothetical protein
MAEDGDRPENYLSLLPLFCTLIIIASLGLTTQYLFEVIVLLLCYRNRSDYYASSHTKFGFY